MRGKQCNGITRTGKGGRDIVKEEGNSRGRERRFRKIMETVRQDREIMKCCEHVRGREGKAGSKYRKRKERKTNGKELKRVEERKGNARKL